jgi:hypothetical protein
MTVKILCYAKSYAKRWRRVTIRLIQYLDKADKHVFAPEQLSELIEAPEEDWKGSDNQCVLPR